MNSSVTTEITDAGSAQRSEWLSRVSAIVPVLESEATPSEEQKALTPAVVEAIKDAGLFSMSTPEELGGGNVDAITGMQVVEEISYASGAAGWCLMTTSAMTAWIAAVLEDGGLEEIFGSGEPVRFAGMPQPRGTAVDEGDGYRFEGNFQFASGSNYANWFTGGAVVMENGEPALGDDGQPRLVTATIPAAEVEYKGNWDVLGMVATASIDYGIPSMHIPRQRTASPLQMSTLRGGPFLKSGLIYIGCAGHSAVALGMARRALREVAEAAPKRIRPPQPAVADQEVFKHDLARHDAAVHSVRRLVQGLATEAEEKIADQGGLEEDDVHRMRQAATYLHDVAAAAVEFSYLWGGSASLRQPGVLGRVFRDMHAATQHIIVDRSSLVEAAPTVVASLTQGNP